MKKRKAWSMAAIGLAGMLMLSACNSDEGGSAEAADDKSYKLKMSVTVNDSSTWYQAAEKLSK